MASHHYHVVSRWRIPATLEEVACVLRDASGLARWWPAAFLRVQVLHAGDADEVGKTVWLRTKGWLPYVLELSVVVEQVVYPHSCILRVHGDFEGGCRCTATAEGDEVELVFDWRVAVTKALVRRLSWLLKPVFVANHRWVMRRGRESLLLELQRRAGLAAGVIAAPPGPTFPYDRRTLGFARAALGRRDRWRPGSQRSGRRA